MTASDRPHRLNGTVFVLGAAGLVVLVGLIAALVTWAFHPRPAPPCTADCPPPIAPSALVATSGLSDQKTFTSSQFGYHVDYESPWKVQKTSSTIVLFDTRAGLFQVEGAHTAEAPLQLIQTEVNRLQGSELPDLTLVGPVHGAHIGTQEGVGELYGATYLPPSGGGQSQPVRIGIIVATRGGLTLVATAFALYDAKQDFMSALDIDYALTEFRWPGQ